MVVALFLGLVAIWDISSGKERGCNQQLLQRKAGQLSDRIVRGRILASDGTVLAQTQMDGGGNETRVYLGDIFDHAVGYSTKGKTGIEPWPISIC